MQVRTMITDGVTPYRLARSAIRKKGALQRQWELTRLIGFVRRLRPAVVVEIGTFKGGTLFCWGQVAQPAAMLISVDLPNGAWGGGYGEDDCERFRRFLQPHQSLHCLRRDSHLGVTRDEIVNILDGRPIDFLHLDGDHTYDGVKADFELYSGLVRRGGLMAFHDIVVNTTYPDCRVHEFWRQIRRAYRSYELVDRDGFNTWGGIGVLVQL